MKLLAELTHPNGELSKAEINENLLSKNVKLSLETYGGKVQVDWDRSASVTPLGQMAFFIEYLKLGGLFDGWVDDCPLEFSSNNAPDKRDVLGTLLLSVLSGHKRYSHITAIRCDGVNPGLLGMKKIVSEDSMRRALEKIGELEGVSWLQNHLHKCYDPLLSVPWVLDIDTTVKVLYGKQEGAVVGYNPKKPGRPSHTYHTYFIGNLRLVLDVEVRAGNQMSSSYSAPDLRALLTQIPKNNWPQFIRGDCGFGTDRVMSDAEELGVDYLFKLKITKNVKKLIEQLMINNLWENAGQGWEGQESLLQLMGWSKYRRVIVMRRQVKKDIGVLTYSETDSKQLEFSFGDIDDKKRVYEYAVLVTTIPDEIITVAQHYRDRADCENVFDELKNQWGWGGYTTQDLHRCQLVARSVGLIYNWWNLFVRLAEPNKYLEAITSRPLLLHGVGKQTVHAGQTKISISSMHGSTSRVKRLLSRVTSFFSELKAIAEHLTSDELWLRILSKSVEKYLGGRQLQPLLRVPILG
jgi:hypothetical protein